MAGSTARAAQGGEGADAARRRGGAPTSGVAVGPGRQGVPIRDRLKEAPRWRTSSKGARSSWFTTSCSGPTTWRGVRHARRSRTGSTVSLSTWRTTTSRFRRYRGRRSRNCMRTSGGWAGRFPGRPRTAATSTSTSTSRSPRNNSARGSSNTTMSAAAMRWTRRRSRSPSPSSRPHAVPTRPRTRATGRA